MANDEYRHKKSSSSSSSSVCEMSMLLVANIIRLSSRRLFAAHSFTAKKNDIDDVLGQPQHHGRTQAHHVAASLGPKLSKIQIAPETEGTIIRKPRSYLVKSSEQVGQTLMRHDINDVDADAENYISQVRGKINGNYGKIAAYSEVDN